MDNNSYVGKQIGNYLVVKLISHSGGFASVYQGKHIVFIDRASVAIKLLHAYLASTEEQERFLQEARILDKLKHPYILPIIEAGIQDGLPYLITEYATNGSLREHLQKHSQNPVATEKAISILSQTGQALQYAHQHNIVHRDLKPDNILFNAKGQALLADFGIALVLKAAQTRSSDFIGSPPYMAPEQFNGKVSTKSDQYALGCIAYELLTGRRPFTIPPDARRDVHREWLAWQQQHSTNQPIPPSQLNPNLPQHIEQAILKAMAKHREDRYATISVLLTDLDASPPPLILSAVSQSENSNVSSLHTLATVEASSFNNSQKTMEQWLNEGNAHFKAKRYEEALTIFELAIRLDSKSAEAYCQIGIVLEELGRTWEAFAAYKQAIHLNPKLAHAHIGKGNIDAAFKRYEEALKNYQEAIRVAPKLALGYYKMGNILSELNRYEEAFAAYEPAIRLAPASTDAYYKKVELLERLKRYEVAIVTYEQIILITPTSTDAYHKKAGLLELLERFEDAIATYDQIILITPTSTDTYYKKANLLERLKRPEDAIAIYDQIILLAPGSIDAYYKKAVLLENLKHFEDAIDTYDQIIHLTPDSANVYYRKGKAIVKLEKLGSESGPLNFFSDILVPNSIKPYIDRLMPKPGYKHALSAYEKALQLSPDNASYYKSIGSVLKQLGKFDQAGKALNENEEFEIGYLSLSSQLSNALWLSLPIIITQLICAILLGFILQSLWLTVAVIFMGLIASAFFAYIIFHLDQPYHLYNAGIFFFPAAFCSAEITYAGWLAANDMNFQFRFIFCLILFILLIYLFVTLFFQFRYLWNKISY